MIHSIEDDEDVIRPKVENLKNPNFLTSNGCAEHYPIWKTPSFVGGRLAELINGSMGGERNPNRLEMRNMSYHQNEQISREGTNKTKNVFLRI